ncbi:MAG: FtsX-like permease family protein [Deltaproteobacteria bacterium]|nr:MAG: FtsX-like permease family protein [Deltaproteobacteria bacterium]
MARPRKVSRMIAVIAVVLAVACAAAALAGWLAFDDVEVIRGVELEHPMRRPMFLTAVACGALLELVVLLGAIRYVFTFFTSVSIGGVTIGTMALVIVLSVMSGFESDLREKILGSNAHLRVTKPGGEFTDYRDVLARVRGLPEVVGATPYVVSEVVIGASTTYQNVVIKGIDPTTVGDVTDLPDNIEDDDDALLRLYPLAEDGTVVGPPAGAPAAGDRPAGPGSPPAPGRVDPAPPDLDLPDDEPVDLSGGDEPPDAGAPPRGDDVVDPAPPDLDLPDDQPLDLSGGASDARAPVAPAAPPAGPGSDDVEPIDAFGFAPDARRLVDSFGDEESYEPLIDGWPREFTGRGYAGARRNASASPRINALDGVLVGRELVKLLHMYVGQEVVLVSPLGQMTPAGPAPRSKPYRVAGVFYTGMYEYDTKFIYVELGSLQRFLSMGDEVNGIEIRVVDRDRTDGVKRAIAAALGPAYHVEDWKEINRNLFSALELEKVAMFLVLAIIILVASFSIIGNLIMVVVEKAREIALLKTLGSTDQGIMKIFVVQGFFIGAVGTAIGVTNGLLACWAGKVWGLPLNPDVYYIDRLPIAVEWPAVVAVAAAGVLISVLATIYPAYLAARVQPVDGLRYE